jgi:hypothetical protein
MGSSGTPSGVANTTNEQEKGCTSGERGFMLEECILGPAKVVLLPT